ncbi:expressed unknown protein [Seminavis robusta]|uniref:BZIP domain-containing protein n=1 Tax=Seminavis robusta TaxID=568900 RepID=A0A9N8H4X7_9STRA|nr:expressed unknown protein [Seminavis robusta]|eukprot:Sro73_g040350.1 n/a (346) ;mRNA; f:60527-61564
MAKMKFLSHGVGGKRSPATATSSSVSGDNAADPGSLSDAEPENETQIERKRRLNRNNERKKRAKRISKIEDLTARFHTLTSENEALKAESKELREKIELVKEYMKENGKKGPSAAVPSPSPCPQVPKSTSWLGSSSTNLTAHSMLSAGMQTTGGSSVSQSQPQGQVTLPNLTAAAIPASAATNHRATTTGISDVSLSLISREQRILLLQREFEKQNMILKLLRLQMGTHPGGEDSNAPVSTCAAAPSSSLTLLHQQQHSSMSQDPAPSLFDSATPAPVPATSSQTSHHALLQQHQAGPAPAPSHFAAAAGAATVNSTNESLENLFSQHPLLRTLQELQRQQRGGP